MTEVIVDIKGPSVMELSNEPDEEDDTEEDIPSSADVVKADVVVEVRSPERTEASSVELVNCVS